MNSAVKNQTKTKNSLACFKITEWVCVCRWERAGSRPAGLRAVSLHDSAAVCVVLSVRHHHVPAAPIPHLHPAGDQPLLPLWWQRGLHQCGVSIQWTTQFQSVCLFRTCWAVVCTVIKSNGWLHFGGFPSLPSACACSFPSCHFGKLYGMILALSAVFAVLQYPCFALVKGALNGDPLYVSKNTPRLSFSPWPSAALPLPLCLQVNIGLTLFSLLAFIHPLYVYLHCRKLSSQRAASSSYWIKSLEKQNLCRNLVYHSNCCWSSFY